MRTVGQILKEEREKKLYNLEDVEKQTKIRKELLDALERGDYEKLPPPTFIKGFIKNYGKFLNLDIEKLLAVFRREFSDPKHPPRILDVWVNPLDKSRLNITPGKLLSGLVFILLLIFFLYLWFEYRFLTGAPFLEVIDPQDKISTMEEMVNVAGKTDPEAKVTINNQEVPVQLSGDFSQKIKLTESVSIIIITSTSKSGNSTKIERTVYLKK